MNYLPPDYPCYYQTTAGQVINLDSVCKGQASVTIEAQRIITVTLAQYNQIKNGMTYNQVSQILQTPGRKLIEMQSPQGFTKSTYYWENFDQSKCWVDFSNGLVVKKLQSDLK
jgi:hypothetical protein